MRDKFIDKCHELGAPNLDPYEVDDEAKGETVLYLCHRLEELQRIVDELEKLE